MFLNGLTVEIKSVASSQVFFGATSFLGAAFWKVGAPNTSEFISAGIDCNFKFFDINPGFVISSAFLSLFQY